MIKLVGRTRFLTCFSTSLLLAHTIQVSLARVAIDYPALNKVSVGGDISDSGLVEKLCGVNAAEADHKKHRLCEMVALL